MSKRSRITVESSVDLPFHELGMGFDGHSFYVSLGDVVIARRGRPMSDAMSDDEAYGAFREWYCVEPGWSVVESNKPKSGDGNLHFTYEPPRLAS
jgi:hypothetical protein